MAGGASGSAGSSAYHWPLGVGAGRSPTWHGQKGSSDTASVEARLAGIPRPMYIPATDFAPPKGLVLYRTTSKDSSFPFALAFEGFLQGRWLELARELSASQPLPESVRELLEELCRETGETLFLAAPEGTSVVFLDVVESSADIRFIANVGQRLPIQMVPPNGGSGGHQDEGREASERPPDASGGRGILDRLARDQPHEVLDQQTRDQERVDVEDHRSHLAAASHQPQGGHRTHSEEQRARHQEQPSRTEQQQEAKVAPAVPPRLRSRHGAGRGLVRGAARSSGLYDRPEQG